MKIVVFTGAGISAESGIKTFRDSGGLWEEYNIKDVATPEAWKKDKELVLDFYNKRRKQVINAKPNPAHFAIASLQEKFDVHVITQNIDDLHERAGSKKVLHLHGEIMKSRSSVNPSLIYKVENGEIKIGDKCENGSQLRPHIVWFGELVPDMERAYSITQSADIFLIIGTSLNVYPAAGLVNFVSPTSSVFLVDPNDPFLNNDSKVTVIKEKASIGVPMLAQQFLTGFSEPLQTFGK